VGAQYEGWSNSPSAHLACTWSRTYFFTSLARIFLGYSLMLLFTLLARANRPAASFLLLRKVRK
jgi:hypothetical protein